MDQVSEQENKGQYCQFVKTADGSYILKPVRVPAHVKAARALHESLPEYAETLAAALAPMG